VPACLPDSSFFPGAGYRPSEFEMFGKLREGRRALYKRAFEVLLKAWTGDAFEYDGRSIRVTRMHVISRTDTWMVLVFGEAQR